MPGSDRELLQTARRAAVYGLGREGTAIVRHLARTVPDLDVEVLLDGDADDAARATADELGVALVTGTDAVVARMASGDLDVVVRSPGVPLRGAGLTAARSHGVAVTSGTNLWFDAHRPDNVVAITGTKGKSTTSSLLAHLLRAGGRDVALLGNIGAPLLDHDTPAATHDVVVVELSSYQLADLHHPLPVGAWLNLHPEHIDWHGSHEAYARDKGRIVALSRTLVANADDAHVAAAAADHGDVRWVSAASDPVRVADRSLARSTLVDALDASPLVGHHHVANLAMALGAAAAVGAEPVELLDHLATFTPLPHRLQLVHDDGRRWVDDSICTIPEAAVAALRAFPDDPVTLLAGGYDREQDHAVLVEEVAGRVERGSEPGVERGSEPGGGDVLVVTMPDTGARLGADLARRGVASVAASDLAEAVAIADDRTPRGGVVLLSPAAPSYGHFTSFEERGARFAALARTATGGSR